VAYSISLELDSSKYINGLKKKRSDLDKVIKKEFERQGKSLVKQVKSKIDSHSGRLKRSMSFAVSRTKSPTGDGWVYSLKVGQVGKAPDGGFPPYARIWDLGGEIKPRSDNPYNAKTLAIPIKSRLAVTSKIWKPKSSKQPPVYARQVISKPQNFGLYGTWATPRAIMGKVKKGPNQYYSEPIYARILSVKFTGDKYLSGTIRKNKGSVISAVRKSVQAFLKK